MSNKTYEEMFTDFLKFRQSQNIAELTEEFKKIFYGKNDFNTMSDEIGDFYDYYLEEPTRWQSFCAYIEREYPSKDGKKVLDVGCGPLADLSLELKKIGYDVTSIDPRVQEIKELKIIKELFNYQTTEVANYDLIVGLEPCDATEHIIRSAISNNKNFAVSLCAAAHQGIDGQTFDSYKEWYDYLLSLTDNKALFEETTILGKKHMVIRSKK